MGKYIEMALGVMIGRFLFCIIILGITIIAAILYAVVLEIGKYRRKKRRQKLEKEKDNVKN